MPVKWSVDQAGADEFIELVAAGLGSHGKDTYYELVARLMTAAGLPTEVAARGKNPSRFDAVVVDPSRSVPVEIKSPAEELFPSVKAVEQALENKVLLDARFSRAYPSTPETASLAIGHKLPPERSDTAALIEDIAAALEINVGIVSISQIYAWLIGAVTTGEPVQIDVVADRRGF